MDTVNLNLPVPDVLGLFDDEAKEILESSGFTVASSKVTMTPKAGHPDGGLRVVRQQSFGREVHLVLAYQKWVCDP